MKYDIIIVGGGIAGLHTGIKVAKRGLSCCIIDEYKCGGRVQTYHDKDYQWENGAGRISLNHTMTLDYLKKYGLHTIQLPNQIDYMDNTLTIKPNPFFKFQTMLLEPLRSLSADVLATHTLQEIMDKVIPNAIDFYTAFPYYAEICTMRADLALQSFDREIGSHDNFVVCKEGLSTLIAGMMNEFAFFGGHIHTDVRVESIESVNNLTFLHTIYTTTGRKFTLRAPTVVLAIPSDALCTLLKIPAVTSIIKKLQSVPLLRMYAVFDNTEKSWFADMKSTVVSSYIRYIIPINKNVIMISYTEGPYAKYWMNMSLDESKYVVMTEIRRLFPDKNIPDPIFFKRHLWRIGCTYWLPGRYSVEEASRKILNPKQGIYVCGESYAVHQCWIESALEHAEQLWSHPAFLESLEIPIKQNNIVRRKKHSHEPK
jgi:protoporphyrinogen oxidase